MEFKTIKFYRTLTVRLMPTNEQEEKFYQFAGASRFIWNDCLQYCIDHYDNNTRYISRKLINQCLKEYGKKLTQMRNSKEYAWLKDISRHSLTMVFRKLKQAYEHIFNDQDHEIFDYSDAVKRRCAKENRLPEKFERKHHPKFKRKKDNNYSFSSPTDQKFATYFPIKNKNCVYLPKIGLILIKANTKFALPFNRSKEGSFAIKRAQIKLVHGKWLLYFVIECEKQVPIKQKNNDCVIGVDLGIKVLAAVSNYGNDNSFKVFENVNKTDLKIARLEECLDKLQHKLSNQYETNHHKALANGDKDHKYSTRSKRIQKTIDKLRDVYFKLTNIRKDYIHKVSRDIVNQHPRAIVLEDLDLGIMLHNVNLSKSEFNQCLGEFRDMIIYKAFEENVEIIIADKHYPSTQLCSSCGHKQKMDLNKRIYKCEKCGLELDRDCNAALNLELYGIYKVLAFRNEC